MDYALAVSDALTWAATQKQQPSRRHNMDTNNEAIKHKIAYLVTPNRNPKKDDFWLMVGNAFENKDGSLTIPLDRLGINGSLIIRNPKEPEPEEAKDSV
jgi:hypothetical protein